MDVAIFDGSDGNVVFHHNIDKVGDLVHGRAGQTADPVLRLYMSASGAGGDTETDGALGNEVLRRFTATFDYSRKQLYLQPNSSINEPLQ